MFWSLRERGEPDICGGISTGTFNWGSLQKIKALPRSNTLDSLTSNNAIVIVVQIYSPVCVLVWECCVGLKVWYNNKNDNLRCTCVIKITIHFGQCTFQCECVGLEWQAAQSIHAQVTEMSARHSPLTATAHIYKYKYKYKYKYTKVQILRFYKYYTNKQIQKCMLHTPHTQHSAHERTPHQLYWRAACGTFPPVFCLLHISK